MKTKKNYLVKVDGERYETASIRRFLNHTRSIKWENTPSVYLRVSYGMKKDNSGKLVTFYNDGDYSNKHDFVLACNAFLQEI